MQCFTIDKYFSFSIKILHRSLKMFLQNYNGCLTFDALYIIQKINKCITNMNEHKLLFSFGLEAKKASSHYKPNKVSPLC